MVTSLGEARAAIRTAAAGLAVGDRGSLVREALSHVPSSRRAEVLATIAVQLDYDARASVALTLLEGLHPEHLARVAPVVFPNYHRVQAELTQARDALRDQQENGQRIADALDRVVSSGTSSELLAQAWAEGYAAGQQDHQLLTDLEASRTTPLPEDQREMTQQVNPYSTGGGPAVTVPELQRLLDGAQQDARELRHVLTATRAQRDQARAEAHVCREDAERNAARAELAEVAQAELQRTLTELAPMASLERTASLHVTMPAGEESGPVLRALQLALVESLTAGHVASLSVSPAVDDDVDDGTGVVQ